MKIRPLPLLALSLLVGWGAATLFHPTSVALDGKEKPEATPLLSGGNSVSTLNEPSFVTKEAGMEKGEQYVPPERSEWFEGRREEVYQLPTFNIRSTESGESSVEIFALPITELLAERIRKDPFVHPEDLLQDYPPVKFSGELPFSLPGEALERGEYFVWSEAPGFFVENYWLEWPLSETKEVVLESAPTSRVQVVGPDKEPISGLDVYFYDSRTDPQFLDWPWRQRLERCLFLGSARTDSSGVARLEIPSRNGNAVEIEPALGRSGASIGQLAAGAFEVAVVQPSFAVRGRVLSSENEPIPNAKIWFVISQEGETVAVESSATNSEGTFYAKAVPANSGAVEAIVAADGFTFESKSVPWPKAGREYQLDFQIAEAVSLRGRLFAGGTPINGVEVTFARDTYRWIPGTWIADEKGSIEVDESFFEPGKSYLVSAWSGNYLLGTLPFEAPPAGQVATWSFPPMGTLAPLWDHVKLQPEKFEFRSEVGGARGTCSWTPDAEESPWLTVGPGNLRTIFTNGTQSQTRVNIKADTRCEVQVQPILADLIFEIPDTSQTGGEWIAETRVEGSSGPGTKVSCLPGKSVLKVFPGAYDVFFQSPSGASFRIGPVKIPENGFDLGLVSPPVGSLLAAIQDPESIPVAGMEAILFDSKSGVIDRGVSDADGQLFFDGLLPGDYTLTVRPNQSALHHFPDRSQTVWVGTDTPAFIRVQLPQSSGLTCRVVPAPETEAIAFGLRGGVLEDQRMPGDGVFHLGWDEGGIVAAVSAENGRLAIPCSWAEVGSQEVSLSWPGEISRRLNFVDIDGTPLAFAKVTPILKGKQLPISAALDESGGLDLSSGANVPLGILVELPDGRRQSYSLTEIPNSTELFFGAQLRELKVVDTAGNSVQRAGLWSRAARALSLTDANGRCQIQTGLGVRVEKEGYWPVEASSSQSIVTLRQRLTGRTLHWEGSQAPSKISLIPLFRLGVDVEVSVTPLQKGAWALGPLPEGSYILLGENASGEAVFETTIGFSASSEKERKISAKLQNS
ncbi:MAG: carboxypeptidase-like regulatory domain-containing protein [Planctomycetota bacterium]|jgi:hypothetical protein|nr:carboxypeptidase-like regulatory domain-containing protein [Planctomycetota bacterium]MDP6940863.1 carboxypeptidase-like regulatory domain-containing protein [Planctomycetota bacterium]